MKFRAFFKHLNTVNKHRWYVFKYCCKAGIPFQGLIHDLSKYSPTEFFESIKYYSGTRSPIDLCKEKNNGISYAWLHHKGRNKHHYEYWQDNFDNGTTHLRMPYKYAVESLCDRLGSSKAYNGENFSYQLAYEYWSNMIKKPIAMDDVTKYFLNSCFELLASHSIKDTVILNKHSLEDLYKIAEKEVNKKEK